MTVVKPSHWSILRAVLPVFKLSIAAMKPEAVKAYAGPIEDHPIYMGYKIALDMPHASVHLPYTFDLHTASLLTNFYLLRSFNRRYRTLEPYMLTGVAYRQITFYGNAGLSGNYSTGEAFDRIRLGISFGKIKNLRS